MLQEFDEEALLWLVSLHQFINDEKYGMFNFVIVPFSLLLGSGRRIDFRFRFFILAWGMIHIRSDHERAVQLLHAARTGAKIISWSPTVEDALDTALTSTERIAYYQCRRPACLSKNDTYSGIKAHWVWPFSYRFSLDIILRPTSFSFFLYFRF